MQTRVCTPTRQFNVARVLALNPRGIRFESADGTVSVLITNLLNQAIFPYKEIIALYFDRWEVEAYDKHENVTLELEHVPARPPNGSRQELFAAAIMTVLSRTMMRAASEQFVVDEQECQFKHVILTLASEAALLVPKDPEQAVIIFHDVLQEMAVSHGIVPKPLAHLNHASINTLRIHGVHATVKPPRNG